MPTRAERARKRYAEDPEYRARKRATNRKWTETHRDQINAWRRRYRKTPRGREKERTYRRKSWRKRTYGLSAEDYARMVASQNGACAICKLKPAAQLWVDHCHATNTVRRLLCRYCNTGLGAFKDNPLYLLEAIAYLADARGFFVLARLVRWALRLTGRWIERAFCPHLHKPIP
jgi:Recombination endonuclease VII